MADEVGAVPLDDRSPQARQNLFLSGAGPYAPADRLRLLAERVEGLVFQEHAKGTPGAEEAEPDRRPPR